MKTSQAKRFALSLSAFAAPIVAAFGGDRDIAALERG